jgi:hypothetical protein
MNGEDEHCSKPLKVLGLTRYGRLGASSRMRTRQYVEALAGFGLDVRVSELIDDRALESFYKSGHRPVWPRIRSYAKRIALLSREQHIDLLWVDCFLGCPTGWNMAF